MRRALLALGIALTVIPGAIPAAGTLAASPRRPPHLDNQSPLASPDRQDGASGWLMVKPSIPVTTRMVIPDNSVSGSAVARFALQYLGYPYTLVGNSPELGFSCIGFVSYVYRSLGIPLPDDLDNAMAYAPPVRLADLRPGDILWFQNTVWPGLSHTGIYLGGGRFVHAAWFNIGVIVSSFRHDPRYADYWAAHYLGASRPWGGGGLMWSLLPQTVRTIPDVPVLLVAVPALNVRRWWSVQAPVQTVVGTGTPLTVMRHRGHWYQIMAPDGTTGWVASARLVRTATVAGMDVAVPHAVSWQHRARAHASRRSARVHRRGHQPIPRHALPGRVVRQRSGTRQRQIARWGPSRTGVSRKNSRARQAQKMRSTGPRHHERLRRGRISHQAQMHPAARAPKTVPMRRQQRVLKMLRVRTAPSLRAHMVQLVIPGTHVWLLDLRGAWKHVRLPNHRTGYVYGQYVQ